MSQTFVVPSGMKEPVLEFKYRLYSQDYYKTELHDFFEVYLTVEGAEKHELFWTANREKGQTCDPPTWDSGWQGEQRALPQGSIGKRVELVFRNVSSGEPGEHDWFNTYTYVDNVRLIDSTATAYAP